jgi:medium-chain acyl-[acyl-carrier-protein] hydrolase
MYSFNSRVRYSEVNSEKELTLPSLLDYLQDCCTFQSEDLEIGVDYLAKEQVACSFTFFPSIFLSNAARPFFQ